MHGHAFAVALASLAALASPAFAAQGARPADYEFDDAEAQRILFDLKSGDPALIAAGFERIRAARDERFVAPLIELLRARQIPIADGFRPADLIELLEALSQQSFGGDWTAWVEWYAGSDALPPPGFTGWKGALFSRIDRGFGRLLPLGAPARIRVEEIVWGGVPFEGIPALEDPAVLSREEARGLPDSAAVFGVSVAGEARAYPLRILDWHELANDRIGGVPISLAWCTLCGSGIVYDRQAADGAVYDFGSSGLLMRSNKLMVDRQTSSLWNQLTGEPVVGPLVDGPPLRLAVLPSVTTTWGAWKQRHPHTTVLSPLTGHERDYRPGAAYADYFASEELMFPVRATFGKLAPKRRVFGLRRGASARAWSLALLAASPVLNDAVGDRPVLLVASGEPVEVVGTSARSGVERHYSAGLEVRAYAREGKHFSATSEADVLRDDSGAHWRVTEAALVGANSMRRERLGRIPGVMAYWFGWVATHPHTSLAVPDAELEPEP